jgi:hypothetical protein
LISIVPTDCVVLQGPNDVLLSVERMTVGVDQGRRARPAAVSAGSGASSASRMGLTPPLQLAAAAADAAEDDNAPDS